MTFNLFLTVIVLLTVGTIVVLRKLSNSRLEVEKNLLPLVERECLIYRRKFLMSAFSMSIWRLSLYDNFMIFGGVFPESFDYKALKSVERRKGGISMHGIGSQPILFWTRYKDRILEVLGSKGVPIHV